MKPLCSLVSVQAVLSWHASVRPYAGFFSFKRGFVGQGSRQVAGWLPSSPPACARGASSAVRASSPDAVVQQPQTPLCERSPQHTVELPSLLAWREKALQAISIVGDAWADQDNGPTQADLETELNWLLDDAIAGVGTAAGDVRNTTWKRMERDLRSPIFTRELQLVQLRAPLETLESVWRQRMEHRVPLQYLTSSAFWRDVVLSVGPGILIPRPETEQVIDFVAAAAAADPALAQGPWADLGTGSGALAIGVARQLPSVPQVWAVDLNLIAVSYATFNAQRLGVGDRVAVVNGSWYEPLLQAGVQQLAGVVSNPPYVTSQQMEGLQAEVGRHEPHLALDGGAGLGIDSLVPICTGAVAMLQPGGFLALETGGGEQAYYVADLLRRLRDVQQERPDGSSMEGPLAFTDVHVSRDLFGVDRFVTCRRTGR